MAAVGGAGSSSSPSLSARATRRMSAQEREKSWATEATARILRNEENVAARQLNALVRDE